MNNQENESRMTGYLLIFIMVIIVGILIYGIISSKGPPDVEFTPDPIISGGSTDVAVDTSETPESSPDASETNESPSPTETTEPPVKPTKKPTKKPVVKPSPKPSPSPEKTEPVFEMPKPDGPPDMEREHGDMFKGKKGKVKIKIFTKAYPFRAYLIDTGKNTYRKLEFKTIAKDKYQVEIPPGAYRLKIVKNHYFTFDESFELEAGFEADIDQDPIIKRPSLKISSNPQGARIYIGERFAGVTPKMYKGMDATTYSIKLTKKGYESTNLEVTLPKGKFIKKHINLTRGMD